LAIVWKPVWEEITIEYEGIRIRTVMDKETGLIACPICMTQVLKKKKSMKELEDETMFFFDGQSLIHHMATHGT